MSSSVGPSRFASTGVRVFVSARWTLRVSSSVFVSSGRGWAGDSLIGRTLEERREELPLIVDALEGVRAAVLEADARPGGEVSHGAGRHDLVRRRDAADARGDG